MDRCRSRLVLPNSTPQRLLIYRHCSVRTCARSQTVYALARAQHVSRAPSALIASAGQSGAAPRRAGAAIACVSRGPVTHSAGCAGHCFPLGARCFSFYFFLSRFTFAPSRTPIRPHRVFAFSFFAMPAGSLSSLHNLRAVAPLALCVRGYAVHPSGEI